MALADLEPGQHAETVRNHWWWRPGWRKGRRFYALHITFDHQPELYRIAGTYRDALAYLPGLTPIPDRWLHLTMQGIGFTDETTADTAARIAEHTRDTLATIEPFDITLSDAVVSQEAIAMPALPTEPVRQLRTAVREGIARALGHDQVPENPDRYRPHISVAYLTTNGPAQPYITAVKSAQPEPAHVRIDHVDLIEMHRDWEMYQWRVVSALPVP